MADADWSELPKDLLNLISQRLDNELDLIRFRSVCSNWHSSSIPNHHNILPFKFPLLKFSNTYSIDIDSINNKDNTSFCYLFKNIIFLIKPKQQQQEQTLRPWLIRIIQNSFGNTQLHHPLSVTDSCDPFHFPHVLDLNKFSLLHLGCMFTVDDNFPKLSF
ncbi:putative F-box domain-containing protein [Medicago truncatula]|uniref:Putative F-box domain-containing protein n=1 Tax=Medicago truncatula TaxID=3880 RepID=A0A396IKI4_MEDTR|nr:putative F-box domain-containing protein [Medicago truncatula]